MVEQARKVEPQQRGVFQVLDGGRLEAEPTSPDEKVRVLIVDDDGFDQRLGRMCLERTHIDVSVETTDNAEFAYERIVAGDCDVALIDYRLHRGTGLELIERCRCAGVRIPLILLTGQGGRDVDVQAMRCGASDYIEKMDMTSGLIERSIRYAIERHSVAAKILAMHRRYEAAVRGSNDGIWDWDLRTGELFLSERLKMILGHTHETLPSTREAWFAQTHPEDKNRVDAALSDHFRGRADSVVIEFRAQHRSGEWLWVLLRGVAQRNDEGEVERIAGSMTDISERKAAESLILEKALHDSMTGLANRSLLSERIEHALQRIRREPGYGFSLLYLDLDGFKPINDLHGHAAGDLVLMEVATRLRRTVREVDCVARVGGDEFVVLLDRCVRMSDAQTVARSLERAVGEPIVLPDGSVLVGASIGAQVVDDGNTTPDEIMGQADRAMYSVKLARKCIGTLHPISGGRTYRGSLESELRRALEQRELRLHYQPIIDVAIGGAVGYEALARWTNAHGVPVSPLEFVPAAERAGLSRALGCYVLNQACQWAAQQQGSFFVAVNVSPSHVSLKAFEEDVEDALRASGLAPRRLRLELTEHTELVDVPWIVDALARLGERGIGVTLDDFGSGYSAMELLLRLPVSEIKLDRSLVTSVDTDAKKLRVLRHLVALAHDLNTRVTAEGIETEPERDVLEQLKVDYMQGFLFGRPTAPEHVVH